MASRKSARPWVIDQCERMRKHVLARQLASEEEVKEASPPKSANLIAWIQAYGSLRAWVWQQDSVPTSRGQAEERLLSALREEPTKVQLTDGTSVYVYPKSLDCLLWFRSRDWMIDWISDRLEALRIAAEEGTLDREIVPEPSILLDAAAAELTEQLAIIAAVACSEGPGIDRELIANPPDRFKNLSIWDLHFINRAFWDINAGVLAELKSVVGGKNTGKAMGWDVFLGTLSMKLRVRPDDLARNRSLVSLLAQVRLAQPDLEEELTGDG